MRRVIGAVVALGVLALAAPASAGWVIDQVVRGGGSSENHAQRLYLQSNRLKILMLEGDRAVQGTVMDLDAQTITHIDFPQRSFTTATAKEYADMMRQGFARMGEAMGQMQSQMKEVEEQLKNLPPEQRRQIEAMMKQAQAAQRPQQPAVKPEDCAPDKVDVKRTGKNITVAGYDATGYQVFANGKHDADVWIAPGITAAREIDPQKLERMVREMMKAVPQCPPRGQLMGADPVWKLMKDGYPVRSVEQSGGAVTEVVKAESRSLAATEFQAPAGFARKTLSELMGGK